MSNVPKISVVIANILFLFCIPLRFAQLLDTDDTLITDDEDPFVGCWKTYSETEDHASSEHHENVEFVSGATLDPSFRTSMLVTAKRGGGGGIGSGNSDGGDEDEHPGAFLPCNYRQWEELMLIWAIPMTWFYLIFFAG